MPFTMRSAGGKTKGFESIRLYRRVFEIAERRAGLPACRARRCPGSNLWVRRSNEV